VRENVIGRKERILTKSRMMEYFTLDGLVKMTGVEEENLDIYILKELIDNGLDVCELEDRLPSVSVEIESGLFLSNEEDAERVKDPAIHYVVEDEGPGMAEEAINEILNFDRFGGTKHFVKKPTRGAQGNALMTILGIPVVLANAYGYKRSLPPMKITSHGKTHSLKLELNSILEKVEIEHTTESALPPLNGTKVELTIPWKSWLKPMRFEKVISSFATWNPHAHIYGWCNGEERTFVPTTEKVKKHTKSGYGSPYWYALDDFENLLFANIRYLDERGEKESIVNFCKNFKGGSSNRKEFIRELTKGMPKYINDIQSKKISKKLFLKLKELTVPPSSSILGYIGKEHFFNIIDQYEAVPALFKYKKISDVFPGTKIPFCLEVAVGTAKKLKERQMFFGINNTITYHLPFEKDVFYPENVNERDNPGSVTGIKETLSPYRIDSTDPVMVLMHLIAPNIRYENYGKSTFETGGLREG